MGTERQPGRLDTDLTIQRLGQTNQYQKPIAVDQPVELGQPMRHLVALSRCNTLLFQGCLRLIQRRRLVTAQAQLMQRQRGGGPFVRHAEMRVSNTQRLQTHEKYAWMLRSLLQ